MGWEKLQAPWSNLYNVAGQGLGMATVEKRIIELRDRAYAGLTRISQI